MLISKKSILIICIAVTFLVSCKIENSEETEPNNTFSTANKIEAGKDYTGVLDSENDVDNYIISFDEDQIARIFVSGIKGVNHAIQIWKFESGVPHLLKTIDDNRKSSPEEIANMYFAAGSYIITVTHGVRDAKKGNPDSRYTLRVTTRSPYKEEQEPNDNKDSANIINNGDSLSGYFSPSRNMLNENSLFPYREEDWFRTDIVSSEENPVIIDLTLSGVTGVDSILAIYNSDMKELALSDNAGAGGAESVTGLGVKESGTYYILVASKSFQYNHMEPYQITLNTNIHDSGSELEPDNSFENSCKVSGSRINGRINYAGDQDFFIYDEAKGGSVRIRLQVDPQLDGMITVYSSDRKKLIEANNGGAGVEEIVPAVPVGSGIYVKVNSAQQGAADLPYVLSFEPVTLNTDLETEPNNTIKEANLINNSISGFTSFKSDKDYFLVKTGDRTKCRIKISAPKNGTIKVSTTDQMGYIIKTKTVSSGESVSIQELFDKKGYIVVDTVNPDYENSYSLRIEEIK